MKRILLVTMACLALLVGLLQANTALAQEVQSLRGALPLDVEPQTPDISKWQQDGPPIPRAYLQQPPLIPHNVEGYTIDTRQNKCLTCHSWAKARESHATKISLTHFRNRFGTEMSDVSPQRYFCTQCHVPQRDVAPLVQNEFKPVNALTK